MLNAGEVKTIYITYHLGQNNAVSQSYCIIYEQVGNGLFFDDYSGGHAQLSLDIGRIRTGRSILI